jgi:hypothetical protein
MKFILVVIVMLTDSTTQLPSVTMTEFNSREACQRAAQDLEATLAKMQSNVLATTRCYEKDGD